MTVREGESIQVRAYSAMNGLDSFLFSEGISLIDMCERFYTIVLLILLCDTGHVPHDRTEQYSSIISRIMPHAVLCVFRRVEVAILILSVLVAVGTR